MKCISKFKCPERAVSKKIILRKRPYVGVVSNKKSQTYGYYTLDFLTSSNPFREHSFREQTKKLVS